MIRSKFFGNENSGPFDVVIFFCGEDSLHMSLSGIIDDFNKVHSGMIELNLYIESGRCLA